MLLLSISNGNFNAHRLTNLWILCDIISRSVCTSTSSKIVSFGGKVPIHEHVTQLVVFRQKLMLLLWSTGWHIMHFCCYHLRSLSSDGRMSYWFWKMKIFVIFLREKQNNWGRNKVKEGGQSHGFGRWCRQMIWRTTISCVKVCLYDLLAFSMLIWAQRGSHWMVQITSTHKLLHRRSGFVSQGNAPGTSFLQLEGTGLVSKGRIKVMARDIVSNESQGTTSLCTPSSSPVLSSSSELPDLMAGYPSPCRSNAGCYFESQFSKTRWVWWSQPDIMTSSRC